MQSLDTSKGFRLHICTFTNASQKRYCQTDLLELDCGKAPQTPDPPAENAGHHDGCHSMPVSKQSEPSLSFDDS